MARQLSVYTKIAYIKALKSGVSIKELSSISGISRTSLYQWIEMYDMSSLNHNRRAKKRTKHRAKSTIAGIRKLAVTHPEYSIEKLAKYTGKSKSFVWKILRDAKLSTKDKRQAYNHSYYRHLIRHVDMDIYKGIKEDIKKGITVSKACEKYGISRTTYYSFKKGHKKKQKVRKYYRGDEHYRHIASGEKIVLQIALKNPDYSIRTIVEELQRQVGAGSAFYVYTVLKPHRLTTKYARFNYVDNENGYIRAHDQVLEVNVFKQFMRGLFMPLAIGSFIVIITIPSLSRDTSEPSGTGILTNVPKALNLATIPIETPETQDTSWGVLAVNSAKAVYEPGEEAKIGFSVLDEKGMGSCFAGLQVSITDQKGRVEEFSTRDNIILSTTCGAATVTNEPDYWLKYQTANNGIYNVDITATTKNGIRKTKTSFIVAQKAPVVIERSAATRVWPWELYTMKVKVKANKAISGNIIEQVPGDFVVYTDDASLKDSSGSKTLSWPISMKAGETKEFSYTFDAADISPAFYTLGQLEVQDASGELLMREPHAWQLAIDGL